MVEAMTGTTIAISNKARQEITTLATSDTSFLRIWVTPGGCSGMTYDAQVDDQKTPFDIVLFDEDGVTVVSDRNSASHLDGLEIDYSDDLINMGFRFANPNAGKACGCGASFAV